MVECPICHKEFKVLTHKHLKKHNMTIEEFKSIYTGYNMVSEDFRNTMIKVNNEILSRPEVKEKLSKSLIEANKNEDLRNRKSVGMTKVWSSQSYRDKMHEVHLNVQSDEDLQKRKSKALTNTWKIPEVRNNYIKAQTEAQKREDVKSKKVKAGVNNWKSHKYRSKVAKGYKKQVYDINEETIYFKSSWEVKVANMLTELNISWKYEKDFFDYIDNGVSRVYIPDFLIDLDTSCKTYLEVKPSIFIEDAKNIEKRKSVLDSGCYIAFITEKDIKDIKIFRKKLLEVQRLSKAYAESK